MTGGTGSPHHHESLKASISGLCRMQGKATSVGWGASLGRPLMAPSESITAESVHAGGVGFLPLHHHPKAVD